MQVVVLFVFLFPTVAPAASLSFTDNSFWSFNACPAGTSLLACEFQSTGHTTSGTGALTFPQVLEVHNNPYTDHAEYGYLQATAVASQHKGISTPTVVVPKSVKADYAAAFSDAITILGTDSGILEFSVYATNVNDTYNGFGFIGGDNSFSVGGGSLQPIVPFPTKFDPWNTFRIPFEPGIPVAFAGRSHASVDLSYLFLSGDVTLGQSATLGINSIRVTDANGNAYTSFNYQTDSGAIYNVVNGTKLSPTVGISAVPEPSTGLLIAGAVPLVLSLRRKPAALTGTSEH